ncbi:MAG: SDR family oxidoreductase [bacterium]
MKVALVTGNVKGIGRAVTLKLLNLGYIVPVHYNTSHSEAVEFSEIIKRDFNIQVPVIKANIMDSVEVDNMVNLIVGKFGWVDILVNNVGDYLYKDIRQVSFEEWKYIIDSNLNSCFLLTQRMLGYIRRRLIFIGFAGTDKVMAYPFTTAYNIAKTGVLIYAKSLAKLLAKEGITVNVIGVGVAENSITKPISEIPMGRTARLDEICSVVEFLINADYITGQLIEVSGGWKL